ncbi:MAG TPA: 3-deoxy-8-phosphooctulonate synthase, partial [Gemmatimonadales bacterium]|nr:3-deoxy-8-phosphooctulonate synthase [Gemmatimonadales bacterium]
MSWRFGPGPFLIAGPCVVEHDDVMLRVAASLASLADRHKIAVCFKASFDKANRARVAAARGPGMHEGLAALERVRRTSGLPILTDVHEADQAAAAADVVDALQIPAFLARQTDLLI